MPVTLGTGSDTGGILRDAPGGVFLRVQDMPARVPLFLHDAVTTVEGIMPGASQTAGIPPDLEASGARVARTMSSVLSAGPQVSILLGTGANALPKESFMRRFVSPPLLAQTIPAGPWAIDGASRWDSGGSGNATSFGAVIYAWRPLTGARVGPMIVDRGDQAHFDLPQGITTRVQQVFTGTASTVQAGDVIIAEVWMVASGAGQNVDITMFYDGAVEYSTDNNAASLMPSADLAFGPAAPIAGVDPSEAQLFGFHGGIRTLAGKAILREQEGQGPVPQIVLVGIASETDTAKIGAWTRAMLGLETDTALPARAQKVVRVGIALETDTVPGAVKISQTVKPGIASETDTALHATISQTVKPGIASETDTVPGAAKIQHVVRVGIAVETDSALAKSAIQHVHTSGTVTELDTAPACRPQKVVRVGIAVETDVALACTASSGSHPVVVAVGIALETDTVPGAARLRHVVKCGIALETDSALIVRPQHRVKCGIASETDEAMRLFRGIATTPGASGAGSIPHAGTFDTGDEGGRTTGDTSAGVFDTPTPHLS